MPTHHRVGVIALLLLFAILSVGCTFANGFLSAMGGFQERWTSTLSPIPDGFVSPAPTASETLAAVELPPVTPTMVPTLKVVEAVYLPFEYGFMVYIVGESCLYAYADGAVIPSGLVGVQPGYFVYCLPFDELPEGPTNAPEEPFGRIWSFYEEVPAALGAQVGDAMRYTTTIPPGESVIMGSPYYSGIITLPDGLILYCGARGATARLCELRSQ